MLLKIHMCVFVCSITQCFVVSSYGWFSDHEPQRVSAATDVHNRIDSEDTHKPTETIEDVKGVDATAQAAGTAHLVKVFSLSSHFPLAQTLLFEMYLHYIINAT